LTVGACHGHVALEVAVRLSFERLRVQHAAVVRQLEEVQRQAPGALRAAAACIGPADTIAALQHRHRETGVCVRWDAVRAARVDQGRADRHLRAFDVQISAVDVDVSVAAVDQHVASIEQSVAACDLHGVAAVDRVRVAALADRYGIAAARDRLRARDRRSTSDSPGACVRRVGVGVGVGVGDLDRAAAAVRLRAIALAAIAAGVVVAASVGGRRRQNGEYCQ